MASTIQKMIDETVGAVPVKVPAQAEMFLKPLHLLYLVTIHHGSFDSNLRAGHYAQGMYLTDRINEMLDMGLISYDGQHHLTNKGKEHLMYLLGKGVQP
jgi:hypothetical protein